MQTAASQTDTMLATLRKIASFQTWNECAQATPQVRLSKAAISNLLDRAILDARAAIAKSE